MEWVLTVVEYSMTPMKWTLTVLDSRDFNGAWK
jgi:hypothetical protein